MTSPLAAPALFDRQFLEMRARVLELAASFDRLDRAAGDVGDDPRTAQLRQALETLLSDQPDRAERVQMIFSRPYDPAWRQKLLGAGT